MIAGVGPATVGLCIEIRIVGQWFKILDFALKELCWFDAGDGRREGGEACNEENPGGHLAGGVGVLGSVPACHRV